MVLYEELGAGRCETRKIHRFLNGRLVRTDRVQPELDTSLSWVPIPELDEINADPQFVAEPMTVDAFEALWLRAEDAHG